MFAIELTIRNSNTIPMIQRKGEEEANELYDKILAAINAEKNQLMKLSCERYPKKKIAVWSKDIAAVQLSEI
ncbi:MAG TPA: hypothetical protein DEG17_04970 [Cyanobacteria bacterium UBA11149]|nr:hypothetical protein [Cyanobacteria bacterium UBA11367]HBE57631.1 hypothetical protein [Cyanobacteria bacterium UBA11366]HBK62156.1 hypothetical protein [Cyanobacteria bacterium UBA11166]HBR72261.1 hypothetical protein [Cyanobacteria bacterium UBA11159]HBS71600.1 hypothetical protein [Cyanobacteria bacterium UBA11153]HBW88238.1 hypothetical protein [Cyanobacteria bacterium UBA11149]HCA95375.1 hypothetical protein [Cyanobacteria bacterium UBA9226]